MFVNYFVSLKYNLSRYMIRLETTTKNTITRNHHFDQGEIQMFIYFAFHVRIAIMD